MKSLCVTLGFAALSAWPFGSVAGQAPTAPQALVIEVENLSAAAGSTALRPADVVRYRLKFTNLTADSVRRVQFTDPVPTGLRYVGGSALADRGDIQVGFSIDGGRTYSKDPVIEEVVDGRTIRRPAPPTMYTHVRWTVMGWIQSQAGVTAEFQAQLPASPGSPGH